MVTAMNGCGTAEREWQAWPGLRQFPALDLSGCDRALILAPHPDDEVLGVGGLLRLLAKRGVAVEIVAVTDGDASHPGSQTVTPGRLAALRTAESAAALDARGLGAAVVHRLRIGDGAVARAEVELTTTLTGLLAASARDTWCLSTWEGDGHPDHEAVGRAARTACGRVGVRLLSYPIWTWHWSRPGDPRVPWSRARSIALDPATHAAKRAAVEEYRTQIQPLSDQPADATVLTGGMLDRLLRRSEVVFT